MTSIDTVGQTIVYTDENGTDFTIDLTGLETLTSISIDSTAGTITYIDEDGNDTVLNVADLVKVHETVTSINVSGQEFTYTDEDGGTVTVDIADLETTTTVTNTIAGNRIATYNNEDGVPVDVNETITTLTDNSDGTYTYTSEDPSASPTVINLYSSNSISEIYDVAGGQVFGATFSDINFATPGIVDADYTAGANSISINTDGRYRVTYRVTTSVTNNTRSGAEFNLTLNGTAAPGTYSSSYQRNRDVDRNTVTVTKVLNLSSGDIIRVEGRRYSNFGVIETVANGSSLLIERLK